MRLKITIAYDGRRFSGWATQPNKHTVQDFIESALEQVCKQTVQIQGSGRTDTGVHADGQVAHFDKPESINMNPYNWVPALNSKLPATIRVLDCDEVATHFHARFSAKSKTYSYLLAMQPVLHPMLAGRSWHLPRQLDKLSLKQAMNHYVGEHDFRAFAALRGNESEQTCYRRTISESSISETDGGFVLTITGSGFLYKMVRLMVGAAVHVAQGRITPEDHLALLNQTPWSPQWEIAVLRPLRRIDSEQSGLRGGIVSLVPEETFQHPYSLLMHLYSCYCEVLRL